MYIRRRLRDILTAALLLAGAWSWAACHHDQKLIDRHEQMLGEEEGG